MHRFRLLSAAAVSTLVAAGLTLGAPGLASASTLDGAATITDPATNTPLAQGGSTTQFTIGLPAQAACSGDTAGKQYHVWGFMVPPPSAGQTLDQEMAGVQWNGPNFNYYNLYDTTGAQYGPANTASGTGQIIGVPNFSFQGTNGNGQPIIQNGTTTSYEVGIACTDPSTTTSDFWYQTVTFTPSTSDPNGFTWATLMVNRLSRPTLDQTAANYAETLTGMGFVNPVSVSVSGSGVSAGTANAVSGTNLTVPVSVASNAALGARDVIVSDANGTTTCHSCLTVSAAPTLTKISPAVLADGASAKFTFTGTGFESGATVTVTGPSTGVKGTATYVSATSLSVKLAAGATAATGAYTVTVVNPDGSSAAKSSALSVVAAPRVTALSPSTVHRGTTVTGFTVTGSGFASGAKLTGPTGVTFSSVTVVNATTITATATVSSTATTGTALPVTVTNSAAAGSGKATGKLLTVQ